jgi:hypothetical protein
MPAVVFSAVVATAAATGCRSSSAAFCVNRKLSYGSLRALVPFQNKREREKERGRERKREREKEREKERERHHRAITSPSFLPLLFFMFSSCFFFAYLL